MKAYTGKGDDGKSYIKGRRIYKSSKVFEAMGDVDELVSFLGLVRSLNDLEDVDRVLKEVQADLFRFNSCLAGFERRFPKRSVRRIEKIIDEFDSKLKPVRGFIIPSGNMVASSLHVARTICRRAERHVVALRAEGELDPGLLAYINRLSSLLFVLARYVNLRKGAKEETLG